MWVPSNPPTFPVASALLLPVLTNVMHPVIARRHDHVALDFPPRSVAHYRPSENLENERTNGSSMRFIGPDLHPPELLPLPHIPPCFVCFRSTPVCPVQSRYRNPDARSQSDCKAAFDAATGPSCTEGARK